MLGFLLMITRCCTMMHTAGQSRCVYLDWVSPEEEPDWFDVDAPAVLARSVERGMAATWVRQV